jgi:hypothetical protein
VALVVVSASHSYCKLLAVLRTIPGHWAPLLESSRDSSSGSTVLLLLLKKDKLVTRFTPLAVPGNVAVLILTCRLARIIGRETGMLVVLCRSRNSHASDLARTGQSCNESIG